MRHDFATYINEPELVELCLNCKKSECKGICQRYSSKWQEINGMLNKTEQSKHGKYLAFGEEHTIAEWAKICNVSYHAIYKRIVVRHQPVEKVITILKQGGLR